MPTVWPGEGIPALGAPVRRFLHPFSGQIIRQVTHSVFRLEADGVALPPDISRPSLSIPAAEVDWSAQVAEQVEELGWTAGLLRTLGQRLSRAESGEARAFSDGLLRHADTLLRLKAGVLTDAVRLASSPPPSARTNGGQRFVQEALRKCGDAMTTAAVNYAEAARRLPPLGSGFGTVVGEALIIARLVEERGGQMRRLAEKIRASSEEVPPDPGRTADHGRTRANCREQNSFGDAMGLDSVASHQR
ncbi:MAG: hypothetical protein KGJ23_02135 [Euryarchaeota archaeon]|nr:hypothetical protein [Euryarchaeota archaeon]MDE1835395.1 hypothetical protein [Euryarchaeota archaeon]MDE1880498.1 hypothetical protein [Euryarchaeota archaeon]MDE2043691.1 hypothetical protein [Thermoplasmata archaeon]